MKIFYFFFILYFLKMAENLIFYISENFLYKLIYV
jgi:hypothetical protein